MKSRYIRAIALFFGMFLLSGIASAKDLYISPTGSGKIASKDQPARDLGIIAEQLAPDDTVHIAAGTYMGKGKNGTDEITVPASIIGGYDETFTKRDPWGKYKTILSGDNLTKNYVDTARVFLNLSKWKGKESHSIVIDGLIVDNGGRNQYKTEEQLTIVRMADAKEGKNPTPESGGIVIWIPGTLSNDSAGFNVTVKNCVITNTAPTQGALSVRGGKNGIVSITNNLIINNTGIGVFLSSSFHGSEKFPQFTIENNTILYSWKYDALASSFSGQSLQLDAELDAIVRNNVMGFADRIGIGKSGKSKMALKDNFIFGNITSDFYEAVTDTQIMVGDLDEATTLTPDSMGNENGKLAIPINEAWKKNWASRALKGKESPVWLNRMALEDAIAAGSGSYGGKGCKLPK